MHKSMRDVSLLEVLIEGAPVTVQNTQIYERYISLLEVLIKGAPVTVQMYKRKELHSV